MKNNEEYGIELVALTDRFKSKMREISNTVKTWAKQTEMDSKTNIEIDPYSAVKRMNQLRDEMNKTKEEIASLKDSLRYVLPDNVSGKNVFNGMIDEQEKKLAVLQNEYDQLDLVVKQNAKDVLALNDAMEETNVSGQKSTRNLRNMFKEATRGSRRFILSLFSIRSIWALISRASRSYLATNDALNMRVTLTSQIMGNILAPIVKKVVDYAEYGVIFIAKLIQMLTGFNALTNISAKNLTKVGSSAKNASKQLAGFDTITNISDTNSSASGIEDATNAMKDFYDKVAKVEEIFSKYEDEIKAATIALGVFAGISMINKIARLIGTAGTITGAGATGLLGVLSILGIIGGGVVIGFTIKYFVEDYVNFKNQLEEAKVATRRAVIEQQQGILDTINKIDKLKKANRDYSKEVEDVISKIEEETDSLQVNNYNITTNRSLWEKLTGTLSKDTKESYKNVYDSINFCTLALEKEYKAGNLNNEQKEKYIQTLNDSIDMLNEQNKYLEKNSTQYQDNKKKIEEMQNSLKNLTGTDYKANVNVTADTSNFKKKMKDIIAGPALVISSLFGKNAKSSVEKWLNSFDIGTNYVPNDQLAVVHKGEMIVPKKYNPSTSGIGISNDDVIYKLDELITALEKKEFASYLDGEKISNNVINRANAKSRIIGRSVFMQ